jgi:transcriptional regulator with XRE-family HTH domain
MSEGISKLRKLRLAAGLSVRELARQIDQQPTNVSYWERTGKIPRSEVLAPMAHALGVTVEELLGQPKPRRAQPAGGRLGRLFESVTRLPRRQQDRIAGVLEDLLTAQKANGNGNGNGH